MPNRFQLIGAMVACLAAPPPASAYSVLTHEAIVDASWDSALTPLLLARFPGTSPEALEDARAFAYGGAVIHDLGYYPFGSRLFSNLLHYVRSGDFVDTLVDNAADVDELAFALGALAHYAADNVGHPVAVNRAVPLVYPKLQRKFGDAVTYVQSPKQHLLVEFSFDVVHVAAGAYAPQAFHRFIGFKIAEPLLERTFFDVYALEMGELFLDRSLAVGTFRYGVGKLIPEMTKAAWKSKHDEIAKITPGATRATFVFNLSRRQYEQAFGRDYARPKGFARVLAWLSRLIPKVGPFRALAFKVPTPEAERLFLDSFAQTTARYGRELAAVRTGRLALSDTNFDVGRTLPKGAYALQDETYDRLLEKLRSRRFAGMSTALREELAGHFGARLCLAAACE
jgi:hypothetical protein